MDRYIDVNTIYTHIHIYIQAHIDRQIHAPRTSRRWLLLGIGTWQSREGWPWMSRGPPRGCTKKNQCPRKRKVRALVYLLYLGVHQEAAHNFLKDSALVYLIYPLQTNISTTEYQCPNISGISAVEDQHK